MEILDFCRADMDIKRALLTCEPFLPPPKRDVFESFKQFLEFSIFFKKFFSPQVQYTDTFSF